MAGIDTSRLRKQCAELLAVYQDPQNFLECLQAVLGSYANRTATKRRMQFSLAHKQVGLPAAIIETIASQLASVAADRKRSQQTAQLVNALWKSEIPEVQWLAVVLLGHLPDNNILLIGNLHNDLLASPSETLRRHLLDAGLKSLRSLHSAAFVRLIDHWLVENAAQTHESALIASVGALRDTRFPAVPQLLEVIHRAVDRGCEVPPDATATLINQLYTVSEGEARSLVAAILGRRDGEALARKLLRCGVALPPEMASALQNA